MSPRKIREETARRMHGEPTPPRRQEELLPGHMLPRAAHDPNLVLCPPDVRRRLADIKAAILRGESVAIIVADSDCGRMLPPVHRSVAASQPWNDDDPLPF